MVILSILLSNFISKRNGKLMQEINVFKDKRIKITTKVINIRHQIHQIIRMVNRIQENHPRVSLKINLKLQKAHLWSKCLARVRQFHGVDEWLPYVYSCSLH